VVSSEIKMEMFQAENELNRKLIEQKMKRTEKRIKIWILLKQTMRVLNFCINGRTIIIGELRRKFKVHPNTIKRALDKVGIHPKSEKIPNTTEYQEAVIKSRLKLFSPKIYFQYN
jgi:hypothetical protein